MVLNLNKLLKTRRGIAGAMGGTNRAFQASQQPFQASAQGPLINNVPAPQVMAPQAMTPTLPENYGFNDLAGYEETRRNQFSGSLQEQLAKRREQLAQGLTSQGQKLFEAANPGILEDLNSRGVLSSPTAVAQSQANALRDIGLSNQQYLNEFDTAATGAGLQSQQDALDAALDLRRGQLESNLQQSQSAREEALARDLANQQRKQGITQSLIGAGGSLLGAGLSPGGFLSKGAGGGGGLFSGLFGGGGAAATGAGAGGVPLAGAGAPAAGGLGLLPGLGLAAGGIAGYQSLSDKGKSIVAPLVNPVKTVKTVGSAISSGAKKIFCFDPMTLIDMENGGKKLICSLDLGDKTKGGEVESVRISKTDEGTLYSYKDIKITDYHAVKEDGRWLRVKDSTYAIPLNGDGIVFSIVTTNHRVFVNGIEYADEQETDHYENMSMDESLACLNFPELAEVN